MCTVSFVPGKNRIFLGSSRDENPGRPTAHPPEIHVAGGTKLIFPKDPLGGGSWVALKEEPLEAGILLNGAFEKHVSQPPYRQSRGRVLPELLSSEEPLSCFNSFPLENIEPFTLILYTRKRLYECRWDGKSKHVEEKEAGKPHVWSSATLYDARTREWRQEKFMEWFSGIRDPSGEDVWRFHNNDFGHKENGILMERNMVCATVSISVLEISHGGYCFDYHCLKENNNHELFGKAKKSPKVQTAF